MTDQALGQHTCPNGHPVRPSARFCPACGTSIAHPVDKTITRDAHWQPPGPAWPAGEVAWPPTAPVPAPVAPPRRTSWGTVTLVVVLLLVLGAGGGLAGVYLSQRHESNPVPTANGESATSIGTATPIPTRSPLPPAPPVTDPTTPPTPTPNSATIGLVDIGAVRADSRATDVGAVLNEYFSGINNRDMPRVLAVMDPNGAVNRDNPRQVEQFRVDVSTTTDTNIVLHWIRDDGSTGGVLAGVTFTSRQEPRFGPDGEACTNWSLTYVFSSQFLIVRTTGAHQVC